MDIRGQIENDTKEALRKREAFKLSTLRLLKSALHNEEIALRKKTLSDQEIMKVVGREVKRRKDAIELYTKGGRQDLVDKEQAELKILQHYLPAQASEEEIKKVVQTIIEGEGNSAPFGKVMGQAMAKLQGKAEGSKVSAIVRTMLSPGTKEGS